MRSPALARRYIVQPMDYLDNVHDRPSPASLHLHTYSGIGRDLLPASSFRAAIGERLVTRPAQSAKRDHLPPILTRPVYKVNLGILRLTRELSALSLAVPG